MNGTKGNICEEFIMPIILDKLGLECDKISCEYCNLRKSIWLEEEYEEPAVDWSKVKVDTPVLVKNFMEDGWTKRYFAKYKDDMIYAWDSGSTSWSTDNTICWKYGKLAEEE